MNNFLRIGQNAATMPLLLELQRQPELWNRDLERLDFAGSPHRETSDVWLRYKDKRPHVESGDFSGFNDPHYGVWYPSYYALPAARPLIFSLMSSVLGEALGGVLIYKIPPGKRIYPHVDTGWHVEYFDKFNLALQCDPNTVFRYPGSGEEMRVQTGDVHWFRNDLEHEVVNEGKEDHIVMTVCIHVDKGGQSCLSQ